STTRASFHCAARSRPPGALALCLDLQRDVRRSLRLVAAGSGRSLVRAWPGVVGTRRAAAVRTLALGVQREADRRLGAIRRPATRRYPPSGVQNGGTVRMGTPSHLQRL